MAVTMEKLCTLFNKLSAELHHAARNMDGAELAEFRKRLMVKYDAGFINGWTVRTCRQVSDTFTVEWMQVWTQTKRGLFGKKAGGKLILKLTAPAVPELSIRCTAADAGIASRLKTGAAVKVSGELEITAFLHAGSPEWKAAEFLKECRISVIG